MAISRRTRFGAFTGLALAATLALAACGGAGTGGGAYGGAGGSTSTGGTSSVSTSGVNLKCASGASVCTKTVSVSGKSESVLADSKGMTLYYFTPDSATTATCTGSCAQLWPPLAASGSVTGTSLSGTLASITSGNGAQVTYNGHPLYHYSGDTSQSDTKGQGLFGKWFVATGDLAAPASGGSSPSSTPSASPGGGYGAGGY